MKRPDRARRGLQYLRKELLQAFWMPFVLIYAVSLLAAVLLAGWLARGFLVPVRRLVHATQEIGAGNWDVRVAVKGRDEINRLGAQFNDMIQQLNAQSRQVAYLEKRAGRQETALTLAHEIRNPLAAIQSTVDRMRRRYRGDDREYAAFLDERSHAVVREIGSLERLVVLRPGAEIRPGDLQLDMAPGTPGPSGSPPKAGWNPYEGSSLPEALKALERDLIHAALDRNGGNKARAAAELGTTAFGSDPVASCFRPGDNKIGLSGAPVGVRGPGSADANPHDAFQPNDRGLPTGVNLL